MFGLFEEIADAVSEAITTTAEVAAGVAVGVAEGVIKAPIEVAVWEYLKEQARLAQSVMDADLAAVRSCDAIYLLRGWEGSDGARKELAEAIKNGLEIMQEGAGE